MPKKLKNLSLKIHKGAGIVKNPKFLHKLHKTQFKLFIFDIVRRK